MAPRKKSDTKTTPTKRSRKAEVNEQLEKENEVIDVNPEESKMRALKGYFGMVPRSIVYYTPDKVKEILPKEQWPVFKYKPLSNEDNLRLLDFFEENKILDGIDLKKFKNLSKDKLAKELVNKKTNNLFYNSYKTSKFVVKRCLVGWVNFRDMEDNEIKFTTDGEGLISEDCLERLPIPLTRDLYTAILANSKLSEEEKTGLGL